MSAQRSDMQSPRQQASSIFSLKPGTSVLHSEAKTGFLVTGSGGGIGTTAADAVVVPTAASSGAAVATATPAYQVPLEIYRLDKFAAICYNLKAEMESDAYTSTDGSVNVYLNTLKKTDETAFIGARGLAAANRLQGSVKIPLDTVVRFMTGDPTLDDATKVDALRTGSAYDWYCIGCLADTSQNGGTDALLVKAGMQSTATMWMFLCSLKSIRDRPADVPFEDAVAEQASRFGQGVKEKIELARVAVTELLQVSSVPMGYTSPRLGQITAHNAALITSPLYTLKTRSSADAETRAEMTKLASRLPIVDQKINMNMNPQSGSGGGTRSTDASETLRLQEKIDHLAKENTTLSDQVVELAEQIARLQKEHANDIEIAKRVRAGNYASETESSSNRKAATAAATARGRKAN